MVPGPRAGARAARVRLRFKLATVRQNTNETWLRNFSGWATIGAAMMKALVRTAAPLLCAALFFFHGCATVEGAGPSVETLPASPSGYELYVWEEGDVHVRFTLITGTTRPKRLEEVRVGEIDVRDGGLVTVGGTGFERLSRVLKKVPSGTLVARRTRPGLPTLSDPNKAKLLELLQAVGS
jgi:hypothetical protein